MQLNPPVRIHCQCGHANIAISGNPLMRALCHCQTCQIYTGAAFADITVFDARSVRLEDQNSMVFKSYQKPALAMRGKCSICSQPLMEKAPLPVLPDLVMVSTEVLDLSLQIPTSQHIFYHRRVADLDDAIPKRSGAVHSQFRFMTALIAALWRARFNQ